MSEQTPPQAPVEPAADINDNDKLMAALAYPIGIVAIIILLVDTMKVRPFQKYHAVNALAVNVVAYVLFFLISAVTLGFGACIAWIVFLPLFWWAYKAYQKEWVVIPFITDFCKKQNWM
jgi:uncharacterized membrane protein